MVMSKVKGANMTDPQVALRKMYETAEEIQERFRQKRGDTFIAEDTLWTIGNACTYFKGDPDASLLEYHFKGKAVPTLQPNDEFILKHGGWGNDEEFTWIPTQVQLQCMIPKIQKYIFQFFYEDDMLCVKIEWNEWDYDLLSALTMDILWLKIVMRLVHNKTWNEESLLWEKIISKI